MKLKPLHRVPLIIVASVIALICLVRVLHFDFFERLERMTYDWRARQALAHPALAATNLGCIFIGEESITAINNGSLGFHYGLYWPRHIYGRAYRELAAQGAKAVAFDILFGDPRPDHATVSVSLAQWPEITQFLAELHPGKTPTEYEKDDEKFTLVESDDYLAWQLRRGRTGILAAERGSLPLASLATNALGLGDITAERDGDGVLRRAKAFRVYRKWHSAFRQVEADPGYGVDLSKARIEPGRIILPRSNGEEIPVPVDAGTNFDVADFGGKNLPPGVPRRARAFTDERVWHMGIVLAAQELKLDLASAEVDLPHGRITLSSANGARRVIPVEPDGWFYINWELTTADERLTKEAIESLLEQDQIRNAPDATGLANRWRDKLVVIGSIAQGNDLGDRGATPLEKDTFLVTKHWNVANSVITGRFVRRGSLQTELLLIILMGAIASLLTWRLHAVSAFSLVLLSGIAYVLLGLWVYVKWRYWVPLVLPVVGASLITHICLVIWRVVFEQAEQRRVKGIFSKVVSPKIMVELLRQKTLLLGGARREVTVFFADVRGFTEMTDSRQDEAAEFVRRHNLSGPEAEAYFDDHARETLRTVSAYLALVAEMVSKHDGTLDKYIGDCVMAFWGAPVPDPKHALACVRAAIDAQHGVYELNRQRVIQNKQIELENLAQTSAGLPPKPLLPILTLGTGINTGMVTVGLMGSDAHGSNYTVFGREVNLASRLESASGRGRIFVSEATYKHLRAHDPALAATCLELPPIHVKGIRTAVNVYEVPWRPPGSPPLEEEFSVPAVDAASLTGFVQRGSA